MPDSPANVIVFDHPLIQHKLTWIRERSTGSRAFRALMKQIAGLMVYEVTRQFPHAPVEIDTPLETMTGTRLLGTITVVPVLRAGLGMAEGVMDVMPEARVGHLGMARDEQTLEPKAYLNKLPSDLDAGPVILVDPMLATGGSAVAALRMLREAGATDLRLMCLVAAPEGIARIHDAEPDVVIYTAAVDRQLSACGFILPGLGDAGDRLYGTVED
ncbi:MAG: uracil phosphoribosyltransferase [Planctomycetota bacterium]|nr:uracil phosphoribosyltransferase [Planctomycetota bacterium]